MTDEFHKTGIVNHKFILTIDGKSIETVFNYNKKHEKFLREVEVEFMIGNFLPQDIILEDYRGIVYYREFAVDMAKASDKLEELIKKFNKSQDEKME